MVESGRLQRAVERTIAAGYQLDKEAFEFLSIIAATGDPTAIMGKALQKMEELEEKPLFINKSFLEALLTQPELEKKETQTQPELIEEKLEQPKEPQTAVASSAFHPYAKDVDAKINVIEDPTGKLSSNGTMEEYLQYFQDRFKTLKNNLRMALLNNLQPNQGTNGLLHRVSNLKVNALLSFNANNVRTEKVAPHKLTTQKRSNTQNGNSWQRFFIIFRVNEKSSIAGFAKSHQGPFLQAMRFRPRSWQTNEERTCRSTLHLTQISHLVSHS